MTAATAARSRSGFDRRLYAPMVLGSILNPINSSMIAVSLIPIGIAFGASPSQTAWLVSALYLATAIGQPVVGRLVDAFGPRPVYLVGTALTGVAGVLGILAPTLAVLVVARVVLGFGTCAGYPASMALIRSEGRRTGVERPAAALAVLTIANQTIAVIGPTLGGLLIAIGGWRAVFTVNIPLSILCVVLGAVVLPRSSGDRRAPIRLDVPGMLLFAATLVSVLLFLMEPRAGAWWLLVVAVVAAAGFAARELTCTDPFLDLRVLRGEPALLATYARQLLAGTVSYAFLYGFTQWLEAGYGLSASGAGLVLLPMFGTAILVTAITGRRTAVRGKLIVGSIGQLVAAALILLLDGGSPLWLLLVVVLIAGVPQGLNGLANQNALYHQADPVRIASSAGLLRTFLYLGAIIASTTTGSAFSAGATTAGLHALALVMLVVAALFTALTLADRSLRRIGRPAGR